MGECCIGCRRLFREFKEFAFRGSMVDLAVGIILGTAFSQLVQGLINDIILPPFGLLIGGVPFDALIIPMTTKLHPNKPPVDLLYGEFIAILIYFLALSLVMFFMIIGLNQARKSALREPENQYTELKEPSEEVKILLEIRDLLATKTDIQ